MCCEPARADRSFIEILNKRSVGPGGFGYDWIIFSDMIFFTLDDFCGRAIGSFFAYVMEGGRGGGRDYSVKASQIWCTVAHDHEMIKKF